MVESRLRNIWALAQNSFNYMFENIHNKTLGQVKRKKKGKVLADCYSVLKKREPDAMRLTPEIQPI